MKNLKSRPKKKDTVRHEDETEFDRKGKDCVCSSKRPCATAEERQARKEKRTVPQRKSETLFAMTARLMRAYFRKLGVGEMWTAFTRQLTITGRNLCQKINSATVDERGVFNFRSFVFSIGWLASPLYTRLRREGWTVTIEWLDGCDRAANKATDRLQIGYFYQSCPEAPRVFNADDVTRVSGKVTFTLPDPVDVNGKALDPGSEVVHLYPYFARDRKEEFSRSTYLRVPPAADEEL